MHKEAKITVGFVGAGWMGGTLLRRLVERPDVEVAMLLESNTERAKELVNELGLSSQILVESYDQIIDNKDIDTVFICTPHVHHGPQTIAALEAGKHVFCEKPVSISFDDFRRQVELARANPELITFVDYILNFESMEQRLQKMLADGVFGTITQIQINYRHSINAAGNMAWKLKRAVSGDAIGIGIIHAISAMIPAMSPQAKPVEVYATNNPCAIMDYDIEPIWNIQLRFDNAAAGFCFGNLDRGNGYDAYHSVYGTEGAFMFDSLLDREQQVRYWSIHHADKKWIYPLDTARCKRDGVEQYAWPSNATTPASGNVIEHQTEVCVEHFINCIKSGKQSPLSFDNSATIAEIGWASIISAAENRPVPLPLDWDMAEDFFRRQPG